VGAREFVATSEGLDTIIFPDEWTMPDGWTLPDSAVPKSSPPRPKNAYPNTLEDLLGTPSATGDEIDAPRIPKVIPPLPGADEGGGA
jgi:hypothetical protein